MKLGLALGAAVLATAMVASAQTGGHRIFIHQDGEHSSADANNDRWLSRDEAAAHADQMFERLDRDDNGRLEDADHEALRREIEAQVDHDMARVRVELEGLDEDIEARMAHLDDVNCTRTSTSEDGERRITVVCRVEASEDGERERRVERTIVRHGAHDRVAPVAPVPPRPPHAPMPMMFMFGDGDESDLNGDGWLSREEFRAQQLRLFDARDANGDGRVRYERPPQPPTPPTPPAPPEPPRRR